jgi:RNA polymerase sigma factor (sigma-70 family)
LLGYEGRAVVNYGCIRPVIRFLSFCAYQDESRTAIEINITTTIQESAMSLNRRSVHGISAVGGRETRLTAGRRSAEAALKSVSRGAAGILGRTRKVAGLHVARIRRVSQQIQNGRHRLVDHARRRLADKRGAGMIAMPLDTRIVAPETDNDIEATFGRLDRALDTLGLQYPRAARVVGLRFLAGLTTEETASELGLSTGTVKREWTFAKAWLAAAMDPDRDRAGTDSPGAG